MHSPRSAVRGSRGANEKLQAAVQGTLGAFLHPASIAVLGATEAAHKAGGRRWLSTIGAGFSGRIYAVNPRAAAVSGYKSYRSLSDLPERVDMAVVIVPSSAVSQSIAECAAACIPAVVVISAGFGEMGMAGKALEAQLAEQIRLAGARLLGPNSAGVFSAAGRINCLGWEVPAGGISLITQSGNMAGTFTHHARAKACGFANVIAVGNAADIRLSEWVQLLLDDTETRTVLIYCEGFLPGDGRRLVEVVRAAPKPKPIVMLKPGASEAGRRAVRSHTGALAGEDAVVTAALAEARIYRAVEVEEAIDVAVALATQTPMAGTRIAVVSDGGGHATIVADSAGRAGLTLASFSHETEELLRAVLPEHGAAINPVDFAGLAESDPDSTPKVIEICLRDPAVDGLIFAGHFGGYHLMTSHGPTRARISSLETVAAGEIARLARASGKPVILHSDHAERPVETLAPVRDAGLPLYAGLESAARAMAALHWWSSCSAKAATRQAQPSAPVPQEETAEGSYLAEPEARERLAAAGIPVPPWVLVESAGAARLALARFGRPVAMKLSMTGIVHKSDRGGVKLGIASARAAEVAFSELKQLARSFGEKRARVLVTPMISGGVECMLGARRDPQFGPVVVFGAGGVLVELIEDVAVRLAPLTSLEARRAMESSRIGRLLRGYRGGGAVDMDALAELMAAVSTLIADDSGIRELDLNPVIATSSGAHIADARMVVD